MFLYNDLQATIDSSINFVVNKFSETKHYKKDLPVYISAYYTVICEVVFKEEIITNNLKKHFTENYCKDESTKDFYLSIISDFSKVIDDECDWVGQSCYENFNEEAITNLRQKPFNRLLLLLCDFLTFSSITAKRYKLESFKPLIIIDNIEAIYNVKSFLPDIITHFIDGFDTLHKYNEQFQDVLTNGGVAVLNDLQKSNTTNSDTLQTNRENEALIETEAENAFQIIISSFEQINKVLTNLIPAARKYLPIYISAYYTVFFQDLFNNQELSKKIMEKIITKYCYTNELSDFYFQLTDDFALVTVNKLESIGNSLINMPGIFKTTINQCKYQPDERRILFLMDCIIYSNTPTCLGGRYRLNDKLRLVLPLPFDTTYSDIFNFLLTQVRGFKKPLNKHSTTENLHNSSNSQTDKKTSKIKTKEAKKAILKSGFLGVIFGILITLFIHNLAGGSLNTEYYFAIFIVTVFFTIVARISLLSCD